MPRAPSVPDDAVYEDEAAGASSSEAESKRPVQVRTKPKNTSVAPGAVVVHMPVGLGAPPLAEGEGDTEDLKRQVAAAVAREDYMAAAQLKAQLDALSAQS